MIKEAITKLLDNTDLSVREMQQAMEEIMGGSATMSQIAAFLVLLRKKTETVEELTAAVEVMRKYSRKIETGQKVILDTCGTGGDKKGSFNISTAAAFIASGAGITVAKHGNRSVSSLCGSADVLEALDININMEIDEIKRCLDEIGIAFLFAPNLHPAMKYAMPVRKELAVRTMFNILGPLTNPAGATHQLLGVYSRDWIEKLALVLKNLGTIHALVVHAQDGLDEVAISGKTYISELKQGKIDNYEITPLDFGIECAKPKDLTGKDASFNAKVLTEILDGKPSAYRNAALINAGCAIYVADLASDIKTGIELAKKSLDSGSALKKLELLRQYSKR